MKLSRSSGSRPKLGPADFRWSVVPHTHWDREWYLPFDHFRIRLARTIDEIVDVMEANPAFRRFTLDGQSVILDDYADLRPPERVARLQALLRDGRIAVGPMYTQPDELLVGGEALIRNLLVGHEAARRHGGEPMPVGYLPDTFGHVAQLPQILRGFGLDAFVFSRGLDDRAEELGTAFSWEAPDVSTVSAIRQLGGYGNARQIGAWGPNRVDHRDEPDRWPVLAIDRFSWFVETFAAEIARGPVDHLLLCNGDDHEPIWAPLPNLLDHVRHAYPGLEVSIDSYSDYVAAIRPQLVDLPAVRGEMVGGREAPVLRGVNSTRVYLKQANERTERALRVSETLASLASLRGDYRYPLDEFQAAWRELLKNQAHDSVSGCSIDQVHRDMGQRYVAAGAIAERVRREALAALAGQQAAWMPELALTAELSIVNPLPHPRRAMVELPLTTDLANALGVHLIQADGTRLPVQLNDRDGIRLARTVIDLPAFGALGVRLADGEVISQPVARALDDLTIANEFVTVHAERDGTLTVTDAHGVERRGLLVFEDCTDRGDEYNFDELPGEVPWRSTDGDAEVRVLSSGPLAAELEIVVRARMPEELTDARDARTARLAELAIRSTVRLSAGIDRIEVVTVVDNALRDHRLRVFFSSLAADDQVRAEGHFAVIHRPARMPRRGWGWREPPAPTAHTAGAVAAGDVTVFTKGLPEYEAIPAAGGMELAITLLRCVGWLSRDDLVSRPGHAGPAIATPEAHCPGRYVFEYAVRFGELSDEELINLSADYRHALEVAPGGIPDGQLLGFEGRVAFSALKGAENRDGVILRVFNPEQVPVSLSIDPVVEVERVRLDETEPAAGGNCVEAGQIGTYHLRRASGWAVAI